MNKSVKVCGFIVVLAMVASGLAAMASADITSESAVKSSAGTIYAPDSYTKINQAVNSTNGEDTLIVGDMNKLLTIRSKNNSNKTVVQDRCNTSRETIDLNGNWSYEPTNT